MTRSKATEEVTDVVTTQKEKLEGRICLQALYILIINEKIKPLLFVLVYYSDLISSYASTENPPPSLPPFPFVYDSIR